MAPTTVGLAALATRCASGCSVSVVTGGGASPTCAVPATPGTLSSAGAEVGGGSASEAAPFCWSLTRAQATPTPPSSTSAVSPPISATAPTRPRRRGRGGGSTVTRGGPYVLSPLTARICASTPVRVIGGAAA